MLRNITLLFFLLSTIAILAQDKSKINLLETDSTWRKETLFFPFPFAKDIALTGEIDVRFTHGWANQNSPYFWSYAFAWSVDQAEELSVATLENHLQAYLGGLMKVVNKDKDFVVPQTLAVLVENGMISGSKNYRGKISVYDAFFSKEQIILNVEGSLHVCDNGGGMQLFFKLSPKQTDDEVWNHIRSVRLVDDLCESKK